MSDINSPTLESLSFSATEVNTTNADASLTITANIKDELSGLNDEITYSYIELTNPSGTTSVYGYPTTRTSGTNTDGNFEFGASASAALITEGANASVDYTNGVAVMTFSKGGLMYEASIGGQKFTFKGY